MRVTRGPNPDAVAIMGGKPVRKKTPWALLTCQVRLADQLVRYRKSLICWQSNLILAPEHRTFSWGFFMVQVSILRVVCELVYFQS